MSATDNKSISIITLYEIGSESNIQELLNLIVKGITEDQVLLIFNGICDGGKIEMVYILLINNIKLCNAMIQLMCEYNRIDIFIYIINYNPKLLDIIIPYLCDSKYIFMLMKLITTSTHNLNVGYDMMQLLFINKKNNIIDLLIQRIPYQLNCKDLMQYGNSINKCYMVDLLKYINLHYNNILANKDEKNIPLRFYNSNRCNYSIKIYECVNYANSIKNTELVKFIYNNLINNVININDLLYSSVSHNNMEAVKFFIDKGSNDFDPLIKISCEKNDGEMVELLSTYSKMYNNVIYYNSLLELVCSMRTVRNIDIRILKFLLHNGATNTYVVNFRGYKDLYNLADHCIDIKPFMANNLKYYNKVIELIDNVKKNVYDLLISHTIIDKNIINIICNYII
jgi:hypothetical protein